MKLKDINLLLVEADAYTTKSVKSTIKCFKSRTKNQENLTIENDASVILVCPKQHFQDSIIEIYDFFYNSDSGYVPKNSFERKLLGLKTKVSQPKWDRDRFQRDVEEHLKEMGFRIGSNSAGYVVDAIVLLATEESHNIIITKELYPKVAEKYGKQSSSIERGIRAAIERVWMSQEDKDMEKLYPFTWDGESAERPTNSEFCRNMVSLIGEKYKNSI